MTTTSADSSDPLDVKRSELREMAAYGPPAREFMPHLALYFVGAVGVVCQSCASRLIGRGFSNELRPMQPVYADSDPALPGLASCVCCNKIPRVN